MRQDTDEIKADWVLAINDWEEGGSMVSFYFLSR
jgi:hypothetical protein